DDALGSTRVLTDASGAVTDRYIYDAFGQLLGHTGTTVNIYLFAGEPHDPLTGLDYLRARYMDAATGRFVSRDPLAGSMFLPLTLNRYLYTGDDAVNDRDPSGQESLGEVMAALEILGAWAGAGIGSSGFVRSTTATKLIEPWTEALKKAADAFLRLKEISHS